MLARWRQRSAAQRRVTTWFVHDADGGVTPSFHGAPCSTRTRLVPASLLLPTLAVSLHATARQPARRLSVHVQGRVIDRAECKQIRRSPPYARVRPSVPGGSAAAAGAVAGASIAGNTWPSCAARRFGALLDCSCSNTSVDQPRSERESRPPHSHNPIACHARCVAPFQNTHDPCQSSFRRISSLSLSLSPSLSFALSVMQSTRFV